MLLSIIVPFHNAEHKAHRLLTTLKQLDDPEVELIFVNDGSTDGTAKMLQDFSADAKMTPTIIHQENRGPGGARNSGIEASRGTFVCFIDCDDDFDPNTIEFLKSIADERYDFIDFRLEGDDDLATTSDFAEGAYTVDASLRPLLLDRMPIMTNKFVLKDLIVANHLFYPEYCLFEDNPMTLLYPFYIKKFYKSDLVGFRRYRHTDSVIHAKKDLKFLDRLWTMAWGLDKALHLDYTQREKEILYRKFTRIFLINSTGEYLRSFEISQWHIALLLFKRYRTILEKYGIAYDPLSNIRLSMKQKMVFLLFWHLSALFEDRPDYFRKLYEKAWHRSCTPECLIGTS